MLDYDPNLTTVRLGSYRGRIIRIDLDISFGLRFGYNTLMPKNYILFGYPGAGKSTQVDLLREAGVYFSFISIGKLLREMAKRDDSLGQKIGQTMASGELLDEFLIEALVKDILRDTDKTKMIIFDGYPRTLAQIRGMEQFCQEYGLDQPTLLCLKITKEEAVKRLSDRRVCSKCRNNYGYSRLIDKVKCPSCGGELIQREDDKPSAIETRFDLFDLQFGVIRHHYEALGKYVEIDGLGTEQEVHGRMMVAISHI